MPTFCWVSMFWFQFHKVSTVGRLVLKCSAKILHDDTVDLGYHLQSRAGGLRQGVCMRLGFDNS